MPLEEGIVAWSRQRPEWQQIMLQGVAEGQSLSDEALDELIDVVGRGSVYGASDWRWDIWSQRRPTRRR